MATEDATAKVRTERYAKRRRTYGSRPLTWDSTHPLDLAQQPSGQSLALRTYASSFVDLAGVRPDHVAVHDPGDRQVGRPLQGTFMDPIVVVHIQDTGHGREPVGAKTASSRRPLGARVLVVRFKQWLLWLTRGARGPTGPR